MVTRAAGTAMTTATMWVMATMMRLVGNKEGKERAARANAMAMRVAGVKEGDGGKAMTMATRMVCEQMVMAMTREMVMKTKEAGEEEGNGKGSKSNGNGKEDSDGKQQQRQPH